ncbi:hypothetical protein E2C01_059442 [Portunus trituberculatus]|uniref:Uncharacterized protein n=1 Tax=Portunus trituberculatus TaxID=210409 RepID=A0A5B7H638_PORTR|nr:hypothetical protein [Portunus trituberculatus]
MHRKRLQEAEEASRRRITEKIRRKEVRRRAQPPCTSAPLTFTERERGVGREGGGDEEGKSVSQSASQSVSSHAPPQARRSLRAALEGEWQRLYILQDSQGNPARHPDPPHPQQDAEGAREDTGQRQVRRVRRGRSKGEI